MSDERLHARFVAVNEVSFQLVIAARIRYWTERGIVDPALLVRALLIGCCELCDSPHDRVPFEPMRFCTGTLRRKPDGALTMADGGPCPCCDGWHTRDGSVWP